MVMLIHAHKSNIGFLCDLYSQNVQVTPVEIYIQWNNVQVLDGTATSDFVRGYPVNDDWTIRLMLRVFQISELMT